MNNQPNKRDRLLADLFQSGGASELAQRAARRIQRRRALRQGGVVVGIALLATATIFRRTTPAGRQDHARERAASSSVTGLPHASPHQGYEIVSESEALSLLQNRSVLITEVQGQKRVIFLGQSGPH